MLPTFASSWRPLFTRTMEDGVELAANVQPRTDLPMGPFAQLPDGRIAARHENRIRFSDDGGASWDDGVAFAPAPTPEGAIACSAGGALVFGYTDRARKTGLNWDEQTHDAPDAQLPCCVARSTDGGKTWHHQTLHEDWTGAVRDMIRTSSGRLVMTSMKMLHDPGRHGVMTYCSDDEGANWYPSNLIDLGGMGHHGGVTEPSVIELTDGTLMLLIRTNWGQFWYALSWNEGTGWHPMGPTGIDASSAPGIVKRLQSGRIALVWNRAFPVAGPSDQWVRGGDGNWSAVPVSDFREELSIAFSEDDCKTWSPPRVMARKAGARLCYPYVFEPRPGVLWVSTQSNFGGVRLELSEEAFL
ncbi:MAG: sialidase family protein [Phycisphaeraceae bacterium]